MDIRIYGINAEEPMVLTMTPDEYEIYALDRIRTMKNGLSHAKGWYQMRTTPLNRLVLNMAEHQLEAAERKYGINRNDQRLCS